MKYGPEVLRLTAAILVICLAQVRSQFAIASPGKKNEESDPSNSTWPPDLCVE
jgi:hypothetical protein